MILTEFLNNGTLIRHYSDQGALLLQNETGVKYADPVDLVPCIYTYTETNELIEVEDDESIDPNEATVEDYQDALVELGVDV